MRGRLVTALPGSGRGGPMSDLGGIAATPELLAAVDALPPATDVPRLPGEDPTAPDPGSGSSGCCARSAACSR